MMRNRRSFRRSSRGSRRRKNWNHANAWSFHTGGFPAANGDSLIDLFWVRVPAATVDPLTGFPIGDDHTLVRLRSAWNSHFTESGSAGFPMVYTVGFGVIAWDSLDPTVTPAVTQVPGPVTEGGADWIYNAIAPLGLSSGGANFQVSQAPVVDSYVEVRSKRKMSALTGLLGVVQLLRNQTTVSPWSGWAWDWHIRFLTLEP